MSGTLFEPILASIGSLREEMLHSLVGVVAAHFREAIHQHGHVARGHMDPAHGHGHAGRGAFRHPELDQFFARAQAHAAEGVAPASVADWLLLEHHVDISTTLCQPLLDLKMQLIVVHHSLTQSVASTHTSDRLGSARLGRLVALRWLRSRRAKGVDVLRSRVDLSLFVLFFLFCNCFFFFVFFRPGLSTARSGRRSQPS
jgi:hypothetical protein